MLENNIIELIDNFISTGSDEEFFKAIKRLIYNKDQRIRNLYRILKRHRKLIDKQAMWLKNKEEQIKLLKKGNL